MNCSICQCEEREDEMIQFEGRWWRVVGRLIGLAAISLLPAIPVEILLTFAPEGGAASYLSDTLTDLFYYFLTVGTTVLFLNLDAMRSQGTLPPLLQVA